MGGLILDNILVFLFRTIVRLISEHRAERWPATRASVVQSNSPKINLYPSAEVVYTYFVQGKRYSGVHSRAFYLHDSARDYAAEFVPVKSLVVRYRPELPQESVLRFGDRP